VDLPVGKSLQSHVGTGEIQFTVKKPVTFNINRYIRNPAKYILPYFTRCLFVLHELPADEKFPIIFYRM
jgi:hypothetical protein